jgi:hypothetical protein
VKPKLRIPAAQAAVTPRKLSAMTMQSRIAVRIHPAVDRKSSGAGFPLATEDALITFPPKKPSSPVASSTFRSAERDPLSHCAVWPCISSLAGRQIMSQVNLALNSNGEAQAALLAIFRCIPAARRVAEMSGFGGLGDAALRKAS